MKLLFRMAALLLVAAIAGALPRNAPVATGQNLVADGAVSADSDAPAAGPYLYLNSDIPWGAGFQNLDDVEQAYNNARSGENAQLGVFVKPIDFPSPTTWNAMDDGQKSLWIVNQERTARGVLPLQGVEKNITEVAQAYAAWLLANNSWGHEADGSDPYTRIHAKPAIAACHDYLAVSENLAWVGTTQAGGAPFPVEYLIYNWIYVDASSNWGHRRMVLWPSYNNNSGQPETEGFMGIGHARGSYTDSDGATWPNADMLVMNVFDPCSTWKTEPPPTIPPTPTTKPVVTPVPTPNTASGSLYLPSMLREVGPAQSDSFCNAGSGWPSNDTAAYSLHYLSGPPCQYQVRINAENEMAAATANWQAQDYTLESLVRFATGKAGGAGLLVGLNNDWSRFYVFGIGSNGKYWLSKNQGGKWTPVAPRVVTDKLVANGENRLKLVSQGGRFSIYLNGSLLTSVDDGESHAGRVGLYAEGLAGFDARFRDIKLWTTAITGAGETP